MKQKTKNLVKFWILAIALLNYVFIFAPHPAHAAISSILSGQICEPDNSTAGAPYNIARCVNNIYSFAVAIGGFVAVLMFVLAGYYYAQGGNENVSTAKSYINSTIIGLVLLFGTYALLNTIDPNLTQLPKITAPGVNCGKADSNGLGISGCDNPDANPYNGNGFDSSGKPVTPITSGVTKSAVGIPPTSNGTKVQDCVNCFDLGTGNSLGLPVKDQSSRFLEANLATALSNAEKTLPAAYFSITEAWPPTVSHISSCHYNGTCADISLAPPYRGSRYPTGSLDLARLALICKALKSQGIKIVNEYYSVPVDSFKGSDCPAPTSYPTTKGDHLHVSGGATQGDPTN